MSGKWELNGIKLGSGASVTVATAAKTSQGVRQAKQPIHGGTEHREKVGKDLAGVDITFTILGQGREKFDEAAEIMDVLEDDEVWTLQSPSGHDGVFAYKNFRRAAFSTDSVELNIHSPARITVAVRATVNGVWIADGGDYCETITGNFELDSTGPSVYIRDDGTNTGATPLIRLPQQTSGYPKAVRASDFAEVQVSGPDAEITTVTDDGHTIYEEDYDLTGFLVPAPSSAGDVGVYQVCSSPTDAYLSGGEDTIVTVGGGMASFAMASEAMASV